MRVVPLPAIGELVDQVSSWTPGRDDPEGEFMYVDLSAVDQDSKMIVSPRRLGGRDAPSRARQIIRSGDVIVSTVRPNLNAVGRVPVELDGATASTGFCVLRPRSEVADGAYLFHWVRSPHFVGEMVRRATGASYPAVSDRIVCESRIPLPLLPEQRRIAEILDKADALRAKRRAALSQLDTLTQSIFLDMFGDPATNPKGWPVVLLRESTAQIQIGPFGSLLHQEDYVEGGTPLVNPKHIQQGAIQPDPSETVSDLKFAELDTYHLRAGDVVMGRRGEMGRCAIVNEDNGPLLCGTGSLFVRPDNEHTTSLFLVFLLSSAALKARLERMSLGQTLPNLNSQIVEGLEVPLPPLTVQLEFAARVEGACRLVNAQRQAATQLSSLFASLQQRAFRGEL